VDVVAGPIAGPYTTIGTMSSADNTCWQNTDLAAVGDRFVVRACPDGTTQFSLLGVTHDGATQAALATNVPAAWYAPDRVVWRDGAGTLSSARGDGTGVVTLATNVADHVVSEDGTTVAYITSAGALGRIAITGGTPTMLATSGAAGLGPIAPDDQTVMY